MSLQQVKYLLSSLLGQVDPRRLSCPQCGSRDSRFISRKRIVTRLVECRSCKLRFRVPQDPPSHYFDFYQTSYSSSMATECPTRPELDKMISSSFQNTEKNFTPRIEVLKALGLGQNAAVLDYGASWGYGVWQFRKQGFAASGLEISRPRAGYARDELGVDVSDDPESLPANAFDCMFSSHVLEHVPAPRTAFELADRVLKPDGLFVAFTPNGSEESRAAYPEDYDHSWGRLHPLYINAEFLRSHFTGVPWLLTSTNYGKQYDLRIIQEWDRKSQLLHDVSGRELLMVICPRTMM